MVINQRQVNTKADGELTEYYHFDQVKELTAKIARTEYALGTNYDLELPHIIGAEIEKTSQQTVEATRAAAQCSQFYNFLKLPLVGGAFYLYKIKQNCREPNSDGI